MRPALRQPHVVLGATGVISVALNGRLYLGVVVQKGRGVADFRIKITGDN